MNDFPFTDADLTAAALAVSESMLNSLPEPDEIEHEFSDSFLEKMDVLIARDRQNRRRKSIARRAAMIALAALLSLGTWFVFDTDAQATVMKWIRNVFENNINYHFFGSSAGTELPDYVPAWLPDGFNLTESENSKAHHMFFYEDEIGNMIIFDYCFLSEGLQVQYSGDDSDRETVYVQGIPADFYPSDTESLSNNLIWIDENHGIVFFLDSNLGKDIILQVAESIKLNDRPN